MEAKKRQPKGEWGPPLALISNLSHILLKLFGSRLTFFNWKNNCFEVGITSDSLLPLIFFLRQNTLFQLSQFVELICVDTLKREGRFLLRYELLSVQYSVRFVVITEVNEGVSLPSLNVLFANATWYEREVWDMFGIFFRNKDLRRILTDYGFKGHPLRKDFPLSGFVELFYDERVNFLQYYPVSLTQEYRDFKFLNPWKK